MCKKKNNFQISLLFAIELAALSDFFAKKDLGPFRTKIFLFQNLIFFLLKTLKSQINMKTRQHADSPEVQSNRLEASCCILFALLSSHTSSAKHGSNMGVNPKP